ncbi:sulfur oxidation c-type cytochrome SoxX [Defluviimonas sp. WL0075]|uniref:Sulfur oxidation c-type cytochrome SoxX n=1 Tax=Albidovulum sediminicola TaxID=2984331 RepID=A0ABT2YXL5_9RHOB|nr:sulfur oxidation c-type cytochrome SoxX [Defluviimonas sp. WL0075]MCV2863598.1 sulfur oxidation c-type cytochrome SoxX [Defluviimonas sp. WL0075]
MKSQLWLASLVALSAALPAAADTAPGDVAYTDGAVAVSLTGVAGDAAAGAKVMTTRSEGNCVACHQIAAMPDVPFQGDIAPALDGVADRYDEAQLRGIVSNAKMSFEGTFMPAFYKTTGFIRPGDAYSGKAAPENLPPILTGQQIEDVVAYLLTLKE